jgi:hypothetical protein
MRKKLMTRQLATSVSEDTWRKILKATDREEVSISSWTRETIEKYLDYKNNSRKESKQ